MAKNISSEPPRATRRSLLVGAAAGVTGSVALRGLAPQQAAASTGQGITDWVNAVTGYGADPTRASDSTSAINSALASVAASGGTVYLQAGKYVIPGPLVITGSGTSLLGAGQGASTLQLGRPSVARPPSAREPLALPTPMTYSSPASR
jgi:hypothetical protein